MPVRYTGSTDFFVDTYGDGSAEINKNCIGRRHMDPFFILKPDRTWTHKLRG